MENLKIYNNPIEIVLKIYHIIENDNNYSYEKEKIKKFLNNIAYWSPEVIEIRFWNYLYKLCIHFFNNNDKVCEKIFNIYTVNINKYKYYKSFQNWKNSQINLINSKKKINIIKNELLEVSMKPDRVLKGCFDQKFKFGN